MSAPHLLPPDAFARAASFLQRSEPLDRALFAFQFGAGRAEDVRGSLQAFQNPDGGFRGLEPDIVLAQSSVLSTCHALHLLAELKAPAADPMVQRALDYLNATFDPVIDAWPIIPPHDNSQPHAPWWHYSEKLAGNFGNFQDNPRADVLACLQTFASPKTAAVSQRAGDALLRWIREHSEGIDMNGLACHLRLHAAPGLRADLKGELERKLPAVIERCVERDPSTWGGYRLRPLDVAPMADSPWRSQVEASIGANLDYLIQTQEPDGSWNPHWNWGGAYPEAWPAAQRKWQAILTLRALQSLRSYGRLG